MNVMLSRKCVLRNQKGLTLLELLAVIVMIGIIAAIAVPSIGSLLTKSRDRAHYANALAIIDAARGYVTHDEILITHEQQIPLQLLISKGYIDKVIDPDDKSKIYDLLNTSVAVIHGDNGVYKYTINLCKEGNKSIGIWEEEALKSGEVSVQR